MKKKEIITELDGFGEYLNEFNYQQHEKDVTKKKLEKKNKKEEIVTGLDGFGDFLGTLEEQQDLDGKFFFRFLNFSPPETLNHKQKAFSLTSLFHHNTYKKEITIADFPSKTNFFFLTTQKNI